MAFVKRKRPVLSFVLRPDVISAVSVFVKSMKALSSIKLGTAPSPLPFLAILYCDLASQDIVNTAMPLSSKFSLTALLEVEESCSRKIIPVRRTHGLTEPINVPNTSNSLLFSSLSEPPAIDNRQIASWTFALHAVHPTQQAVLQSIEHIDSCPS